MFNSVGFKAKLPIADLGMRSSASTELNMCINYLDSAGPKAMGKGVTALLVFQICPK